MRAGDLIDGRFELGELVATGGMGRVYRAVDRLEGRSVAVKVIRLSGDVAVERFGREVALMAELHHPGIVRYVAHGTLESGPYLAMEWLDGKDLDAFLRANGGGRAADTLPSESSAQRPTVSFRPGQELTLPAPERPPAVEPVEKATRPGLPVSDALAVGRRVASALAELHRRGILHRDIKPSNLFLVSEAPQQTKLLDFGTARYSTGFDKLTAAGSLIGTPSYMSPEQASGRVQLAPAVDVWGLGCVLHEILAGRPPFEASHPLAILVRIMMDEPPDLAALRPDAPADLVRVIRKMLAKDPAERFPDGASVHAALDAVVNSETRTLATLGLTGGSHGLDERAADSATSERVSSSRPSLSLTTEESRVFSLLLARGHGAAVSPDSADFVRMTRGLERFGCLLTPLADGCGSLLITSKRPRSPKELASNLARAALFVREQLPSLSLLIATGRGRLNGSVPVGEVLDQAVSELLAIAPGDVRIDRLTAPLLEGRFELRQTDRGKLLGREHDTEGTRTLLGKPTAWVGRARELATLIGTFEECVAESAPRVVIVTAQPGVGKTRLQHELIRSLSANGHDFGLLLGQGDALSAGSPFTMIGPALRRAAAVYDGEPIETRRQKLTARLTREGISDELQRAVPFLGELVGIPFDDATNESLRAARKDPMLLGDLMRRGFIEWLRVESATRPLLIVLEDLHWGDAPSVHFLDAALQALPEARLFLLALARPEVHETFPGLWSQRHTQELRLHQLSKTSCEKLVRNALGEGADPAIVATIVTRAGGNAFLLEELVRSAAEGKLSETPETVLGMVQARLDAVDLEARRLLRAAGIFGEVFWQAGVAALLGGDCGAFQLNEWLEELCRQELIVARSTSRLPGQQEFKFRHALVQDAVYQMLTADDRALGHRLAGEWLSSAGESDPLVLAEHFTRGGDGEHACFWYQRAAEQALEGNDLAAVLTCAERAIRAGARGEQLGSLRALQAQAAYWKSEYQGAKEYGEAAIEKLPEGTAGWFRAVGSTIVSSARTGDLAGVDRLFARVLSASAEPDAVAARLICLCRGTFQLIFRGEFGKADAALARIAELARTTADLDALTRAQVHHVQGVRAAHVGDVATFLRHLQAAVAAFEIAGDTRNVSLERTTVAWCFAELGDIERAYEHASRSLEFCQRIGAQQAITYAKVNLGFIQTYRAGGLPAARGLLGEAIAECQAVGNLRLEGWARAHLATVEHYARDLGAELEQAEIASERLLLSPGLHGWALAVHARALVRHGRPKEALPRVERAIGLLNELGGLLQGESLPLLVSIETRLALGERERARNDALEAKRRLLLRAERLDADFRESFLALPDNARTLSLAAELRCG
jgi:serine/threonine protein kinase/tetratricopeptide (TPR) repeat protein